MNTEITKQLQDKLIDTCDAMLGLVNMSSEQLVKIVSLERELAETKPEAEKWEKLHDQDTEHLASLQKRDNYGPTETLNETAMRLSLQLGEARDENKKLIADMILHERMSSKFQDERDTLAEALRKCVLWAECMSMRCERDRDNINWSCLNDAREALATVKGGEA